jgi:GPH family glycoside/pentoside/hexuronide:cation symporter
VDIIEWQSGRRLDSLVSTADNLASKLAVAGATQLVALSLSLNGFDAKLTAQPAGAITAINAILGWIPMVVAAVMMVVILFINIEKDTQKMLEEKAANA